MYSVHKYKTAVRNTAVIGCRKSLFFQKSACSQSLTPSPFPVVKGCVCLVGSASCRAFWHTRLASVPGLYCWGYRPWTKQGCLQSATQSHYARTHNDSHTKPLHDATAQMAVNAQMQWHKWLTTCTGAMPLRPHFQ